MMQYFIEHEELVQGKTNSDLTFYMWTTIGKIMTRCIMIPFLSGHHQVIENFATRYKINYLFLIECCFGVEKRS